MERSALAFDALYETLVAARVAREALIDGFQQVLEIETFPRLAQSPQPCSAPRR
jgi:hypothetical protein